MKNIIKPIVFIAILGGMLAFLSLVFEPKDNLESYDIRSLEANGILGEPKNTIDILFLGDSELYSSISPLQLFNEYGIASYVTSTAGQKLFESWDFLKKTMKNQNLKMVVLDCNLFFRKMKYNEILNNKLENFLAIFKYHNRWKHLTKKDLLLSDKSYTYSDKYKGYLIRNNIKSVNKYYEKQSTDKIFDINIENVFYINKIINECQKRGIEVLFVSTPSYIEWTYAKHNAIELLAKKNNVSYFDLNIDNIANIDWKADTVDAGDHLNYLGARKTTTQVGKYIKDNYNLVDHRYDVNYQNWYQLINNYYEKIRSIEKSS